jgi:hypothetical protein
MKYFHRTSVTPEAVMRQVVNFFGGRLTPVEEGARRRAYTGVLGALTVTVAAEGGHYTLVTVETNQPGESELDRMGKRFLAEVHVSAEPTYSLRGAY